MTIGNTHSPRLGTLEKHETIAEVCTPWLTPNPPSPSALPEQVTVTKQDLLKKYGSFNGCRSAAKKQGVKFSKTPSWAKLEAAFSHKEAVQELVQGYLANFPAASLEGVSFEIKLSGS